MARWPQRQHPVRLSGPESDDRSASLTAEDVWLCIVIYFVNGGVSVLRLFDPIVVVVVLLPLLILSLLAFAFVSYPNMNISIWEVFIVCIQSISMTSFSLSFEFEDGVATQLSFPLSLPSKSMTSFEPLPPLAYVPTPFVTTVVDSALIVTAIVAVVYFTLAQTLILGQSRMGMYEGNASMESPRSVTWTASTAAAAAVRGCCCCAAPALAAPGGYCQTVSLPQRQRRDIACYAPSCHHNSFGQFSREPSPGGRAPELLAVVEKSP